MHTIGVFLFIYVDTCIFISIVISSKHKNLGTRRVRTADMGCFQQSKQVLAMVATSFSLAIVNILLKKVLNEGMDHLLIIMYRQMVSAIFLTPVAYIWERYAQQRSYLLCSRTFRLANNFMEFELFVFLLCNDWILTSKAKTKYRIFL